MGDEAHHHDVPVQPPERMDALSCEVLEVVEEESSVITQVCSALRKKREELTQAIEEMRGDGACFLRMLRTLEDEEMKWMEKLEVARKRKTQAEKQKIEVDLLLDLHRSLGTTGGLNEWVKTIQKTSSTEVPEDMKVMVDDCLNHKTGVHTGECILCFSEFTAADLLSVETSDKCRHSIYPCGHAAVCGTCAKKLWLSTRRCPLCRVEMTKKPKIFKPGRWQKE